MKTSAIRIDAVAKGNVRAVILADDAAGAFEDVVRRRMLQGMPVVLVESVEVDLSREKREAVGRCDVRAKAVGGRLVGHDEDVADGWDGCR
jgi:hypothetical protein